MSARRARVVLDVFLKCNLYSIALNFAHVRTSRVTTKPVPCAILTLDDSASLEVLRRHSDPNSGPNDFPSYENENPPPACAQRANSPAAWSLHASRRSKDIPVLSLYISIERR